MTLAALVLAEMLRVGAADGAPAPERYTLSDFCASVERETFRYQLADFARWIARDQFRYRLADFSTWLERDGYRYRLTEFADAVERDAERCICMTTRLSPATLKSEVLLVSDCECGR